MSEMDAEASTSATPEVPISKNARKKAAKLERMQALKPLRRAREKEKAKAKKAEIKRAVEAGEMEEPPKKRKLAKAEITPFDAHIVIDLAFDHKMLDKEIVSMSSQIGHCYSANRKSSCPVNVVLASLHGKLKERMDVVGQKHHEKWDRFYTTEKPIAALWEDTDPESTDKAPHIAQENFIYLTADSPNTIDTIEPGKAYVLGGIVDKNRYKNLCFNAAKRMGVQHAALPIGQYIADMPSRKVLTVNHVFEIMVKWIECKDWQLAFDEVIPKRKFHTEGRKAKKKKRNAENDEEDEQEDDDEQEAAADTSAQDTVADLSVRQSQTGGDDNTAATGGSPIRETASTENNGEAAEAEASIS